jgi:DNA invertase Pin-like site-specific DNA recombinase
MARGRRATARREALSPASPTRRRCAVYTRKSSEEGLEQSFNSLHAQRDACEAYIASQRHEGWAALPQLYDDGGLSGGSMDRPALRQLLDDVRAGLVDIVVVYKVDRLTRSLADFAKLTELFDAHGTSFVSVTQQFNTSTSMGRLTLNVLLSFAQFEREVAGERIRDKIALSKRRGMWVGGLPPLGYDGIDRKLVVNSAEAETVRLIFRTYLELGSIGALKAALDGSGVRSKRRRFSDGREVGGAPLSRGAIYLILRNQLYRGQIAHRGEVHQGNHEAIIDVETWDAVQTMLTAQSGRGRGSGAGSQSAVTSVDASSASPLTGLVFDERGHRLSPVTAVRRGRRYRYYVSAPLVRGVCNSDGLRIPAPDLEALVASTLHGHLSDPGWVIEVLGVGLVGREAQRLIAAAGAVAHSFTGASTCVRSAAGPNARIIVGRQKLTIELDAAVLAGLLADTAMAISGEPLPLTPVASTITVSVPAHPLRCGKEMRIVVGSVESERRAPDPQLVALVSDAHRWFESLRNGRHSTIAGIAAAEKRPVADVSRIIALAFLAPDIVEMILTGRQPATLTPERLKPRRPLPLDWSEQRALLFG